MLSVADRRKLDAIDLEIMRNRLITLVDEAAFAVRRTSTSKVVVEGADFGVLLYDAAGRMIASDFAIASKISTIAVLAEKLLKNFPASDLRPGDVLVTNNPWWIMGHLNDLAVLSPLFLTARSSALPSVARTWRILAVACRPDRARSSKKA